MHTELWVWLAPAARQMYVIDNGELCCSSMHSSDHAAECSVQLAPWSVLMVSRGQFSSAGRRRLRSASLPSTTIAAASNFSFGRCIIGVVGSLVRRAALLSPAEISSGVERER